MDGMTKFFVDLLEMMGYAPTKWRVTVMREWATKENVLEANGATVLYNRAFNPLATTWTSDDVRISSVDIGHGKGNWNSVPVKIYATHEDGVLATYKTLMLNYYPAIRNCLKDQTGYLAAVGNFKTWVGSEAYGKDMINFMNNCFESRTELVTEQPVVDPVKELNDAVLKRLDIIGYASRLTTIACGDYEEVLKLHSQLKKFF